MKPDAATMLAVTTRPEPAFQAAEAKLQYLASFGDRTIEPVPAMLLRCAHNELTDYGTQAPLAPGLVDHVAGATITDVVEDLGVLRTAAAAGGDLAEVLRLERALEYVNAAHAAQQASAKP